MKVFTKIVLDMASGEVVDQHWYSYDGAVAECGGGKTKSTTTVNIPKPTAQEKEDQARQRAIQDLQLQQSGFQLVKQSDGSFTAEAIPLSEEQQRQLQTEQELQEFALRRIKGETSPEEEARIQELFQSQRTLGNEEINRFLTEIAGARGLNATDSPILRESLLAKTRLETGLRGAEAGARLNFTQSQQLFGQSLREFQEQLQQQRFLNLAGIGDAFGASATRQASLRSLQPTTIQRGGGGGSALGGGLFGALGNIGGGLLSNPSIFSSREFKDNIEPIDNLDAILASIDETPVYRWNYKQEFGDPRRHIGPVTEESPQMIVTEDGKALVTMDYMGMMFAAIKALSAKVKALEAA